MHLIGAFPENTDKNSTGQLFCFVFLFSCPRRLTLQRQHCGLTENNEELACFDGLPSFYQWATNV